MKAGCRHQFQVFTSNEKDDAANLEALLALAELSDSTEKVVMPVAIMI